MTAETLIIALLVLFALNAPIAIAIGGASVVGILVYVAYRAWRRP